MAGFSLASYPGYEARFSCIVYSGNIFLASSGMNSSFNFVCKCDRVNGQISSVGDQVYVTCFLLVDLPS